MLTENKKIAVYCRVARADKKALKHQIRQVAKFAVESGYSGGRIYHDKGIHGATVDRPAFNRLNRDMLAGKVDMVVVKDLSRIARNFILLDRWLNMANALGVEVISMDNNIGAMCLFTLISELENRR